MQRTSKLAVTAALVIGFTGTVGWSMTQHHDKALVAIQQEAVQSVAKMTAYMAMDAMDTFRSKAHPGQRPADGVRKGEESSDRTVRFRDVGDFSVLVGAAFAAAGGAVGAGRGGASA